MLNGLYICTCKHCSVVGSSQQLRTSVFWPLFFPTQELQKALDKRKAIVLSVNLCSGEFVQWDSEESREMQARLTDMNNHWDKLGRALEGWRASLQDALMQCQVGVRSTAKVTL